MSTLLYTHTARAATPSDEANVRSTVTVVQPDAPASVMAHSPDFNEVDTDPVTEGGLTPHQLASHVIPRERYVPLMENSNEADALFGRVNNAISTSGTAAAREAAGEWGHGTLTVLEGIEPVIRDGNAFSETYFKAREHPIQETMGHDMSPSEPADAKTRSDAAAAGKSDSRAAYQASLYKAFYNGVTG